MYTGTLKKKNIYDVDSDLLSPYKNALSTAKQKTASTNNNSILKPYTDAISAKATGAASLAPTATQNYFNQDKIGGTFYDKLTKAASKTQTSTDSTSTTDTDPLSVYKQYLQQPSNTYNAYDAAASGASSAYQKLVKEADETAKRKEVYADTRRVLMDKYMDDTMNAMGFTNTGLASQAAISMDNNYNQYVMGAMSEATDAKEDALYNYRQAMAEISAQRAAAEQATAQQQQQYLLSILEMAQSGEFDWDYIQSVGGLYGLTEDQMQGIYNTYQNTETNKKKANYATAFGEASSWTGSRASFDEYLKAAGFTDTERNNILAEYDENNTILKTGNSFDDFKTQLGNWISDPASYDFDTDAVDKALEKGYLEPEERGELIKMYNDAIDAENYFAGETSKARIKKMYDNAMADTWLGSDLKAAIDAKYKDVIAKMDKEIADEDIPTLAGMGVDTNNTSSIIDPQYATPASVYGIIDVARGDAQKDYIQRILDVSKTWNSDMNGTLVSFNYGAGNPKGEIFVYWNGKWYQTDFVGANDAKKQTGNPVYGTKNNKYLDFYARFGFGNALDEYVKNTRNALPWKNDK